MALFGFGRKGILKQAAVAKSATQRPPSQRTEPVFSRALTLGEDHETLYIMTDEHRQNARRLVAVTGADGWGWALVRGTFLPEPKNPYDSNAVLVMTESGPIGYFSRGAQDVAKRMIARSRQRPTIEVGLWLSPDGRISARYFASRRQRDDWVKEREGRSREALMPSVTLKASQEFQTELTEVQNRYGEKSPCRIEVDGQPSGKYKGGPRLTFHVDQVGCVGRVEARYQRDEAAFFNTVLAGTEVGELRVLESYGGGWYARVYLDAEPPDTAPVWSPPSQDRTQPESEPTDGMPKNPATVVLPRGSRMQVTGEERYHERLSGWLAGRDVWDVMVTLHADWPARADTAPRMSVRLFGEPVGQLTPATTEQLRAVVEACEQRGLLPACCAQVKGNDLRVDVVINVAKGSAIPQSWLDEYLPTVPAPETGVARLDPNWIGDGL